MKHASTDNTSLTQLARKVRLLNRRAHQLENRKHMSLPIYDIADPALAYGYPGYPDGLDHTDPPDLPIEGTIALNKTGTLYWFLDGEWRTCPSFLETG